MIDLKDKTYQKILSDMLSLVPDTFDKRDGSPIQTALGPAAWAIEGLYLSLNQVQSSAFVQTAVGQSLDYLAIIAGISRYPASAAVRLGVFNTAIPIGSRFSTINGEQSINFAATAKAAGQNEYELTAETPGSIGNDYTGPILPITPIPGLSSAYLSDILVPGDDEETDDELRERLITALNERPFGGNIASYRQAALEIDGVGAVQVYPTWNGGGTVKLFVLGADLLPASPQLVQDVQSAIDPPPNQGLGLGLAPIGAKATVAAPEGYPINVSAALDLMPGYQIGQMQQPVEEAISQYLLTIRQDWDKNTGASNVQYSANVYLSRVTAAIVGVQGVVNASNVALNGAGADLILTQTGTVSQVPILGTVSLNG